MQATIPDLETQFRNEYPELSDAADALDWDGVEEANHCSDGDLGEEILNLERWEEEANSCSSLEEAVMQITAWYV